MKRRLSCFSILLWLSTCVTADAHVRWFISDEEAAAYHTDISNGDVATLLVLAALMVWLAIRLWKRFGPSTSLSMTPALGTALRWAMALSLGVAAACGYLVTPDHGLDGDVFDTVLRLAEAATAVGLAVNGVWGGWMLAALLALGTAHDSDFCLDHIGTVGFALYFILQQRKGSWRLLQAFVGVDLIRVALDEKLLHPQLALAFLHHYHWNFLPSLGLNWVTNELFVLLVGTVEVVVGGLLLVNAFAPVAALAVLTLMTLTAALLGPGEVAGHLPYMAFCGVLLWQWVPRSLLIGRRLSPVAIQARGRND